MWIPRRDTMTSPDRDAFAARPGASGQVVGRTLKTLVAAGALATLRNAFVREPRHSRIPVRPERMSDRTHLNVPESRTAPGNP
jgi:hypothetical protein